MRARIYVPLVCLLWLTACDESAVTDPLAPEVPTREVCEAFLDVEAFVDGEAFVSSCFNVDFVPEEHSVDIAEYPDQSGDPSDPEWNGESIVEAGSYICPPFWDTPVIRARLLHNGETVYFYIPARAPVDPAIFVPSPDGIPRAAYIMPPGQYRDLSGRYVAEGGRIYARCFVKQVFTGGYMAYVGPMVHYDYTGVIMDKDDVASMSAGRGWAYKDAELSVENGVGSGWKQALDKYLAGQGCTPGWEIWVDRQPKCHATGGEV